MRVHQEPRGSNGINTWDYLEFPDSLYLGLCNLRPPLNGLILTSFRSKWGVSECVRVHQSASVGVHYCSAKRCNKLSETCFHTFKHLNANQTVICLFCLCAHSQSRVKLLHCACVNGLRVRQQFFPHCEPHSGEDPCRPPKTRCPPPLQTIISNSPKHFKLKSCSDGWLSISRRYCTLFLSEWWATPLHST